MEGYPVAVAGCTVGSDDDPVHIDLINPATGQSHRSVKCGGAENEPVRTVKSLFGYSEEHPDVNLVAFSTKGKVLRVLDLNSRTEKHVFPHGHHIRCFSFLPPNLLVSAASNSIWRVFSLDTGEVVHELTPDHTRQFNVTSFVSFVSSRALKRYRVASGNMDRRTPTVKIWDPTRWTCLNTYRRPHPNGSVECLEFHDRMRVVLSGSEDGTIKLLDPGMSRIAGTIKAAKGWVKTLVVPARAPFQLVTAEAPFVDELQYVSCYDLRMLADFVSSSSGSGTADPSTPVLWNTGLTTLGGDVVVGAVPFGADDDLIVAANDQRELTMYSRKKDGEVHKKFSDMPYKFSALCGVPVTPQMIDVLYAEKIQGMGKRKQVVNDLLKLEGFSMKNYPKLTTQVENLGDSLQAMASDLPDATRWPPSVMECKDACERFKTDVKEEIIGDAVFFTILGEYVTMDEDTGSATPSAEALLKPSSSSSTPPSLAAALAKRRAAAAAAASSVSAGSDLCMRLRRGQMYVRKKRGLLRKEVDSLFFSGTFTVDGRRHGRGTEYHEDGKTPSFTGMYVDGMREGDGKEFYDGGLLKFRGMYSEDKKHGRGMVYDEDGLTVMVDGWWEGGECVKRKEESIQLQEIDFRSLKKQLTFENEIGRGGNGRVYKVKWSRKTCAAKVVDGISRQVLDRRVLDESLKVLASLNHPNIIKVFGVFYDEQVGYVMEFCLRSVADIISPELPREERLRILLDTAEGVKYLHNKKWLIMHRDLKWENVLMDPAGVVKITDFDFAKIDESKWRQSKANHSVVGTIDYIAPEIWCNEPYSTPCDVFSFSMMMYIMLFGKSNPYEGMEHCTNPRCRCESTKITPASFASHLVNCRLRPTLPAHNDGVDPRLVQLMKLCWSSDALRRPSFAQIVDVINQVMRPEKAAVPLAVRAIQAHATSESKAIPETPGGSSPPKSGTSPPRPSTSPSQQASTTPTSIPATPSRLVRVCRSTNLANEDDPIILSDFSYAELRRLLETRYKGVVRLRREKALEKEKAAKEEKEEEEGESGAPAAAAAAAAAEAEPGISDPSVIIEKLTARMPDGSSVLLASDEQVRSLLIDGSVVVVVHLPQFGEKPDAEEDVLGTTSAASAAAAEKKKETGADDDDQRKLLGNLQQQILILAAASDEKDALIRKYISQIRTLVAKNKALEEAAEQSKGKKKKKPPKKRGSFWRRRTKKGD